MQLFQLPKSATTEVGLLIDRRIKQRSARYPIGGVPKRLLDILISSSALLAFTPLLLLIALLLKITDRGNIIYRQPRVGFRSSTFGCLKFRTMAMDGDAVLARYLRDYPEAAKEWAETRKLRRDPRVTAVGQVLRQTSLDELPQLWNVLRGDMSIVGPRPPLPYELEQYKPWHRRRVLEAKPGLTGLWQVAGRSRTTFDEMVRLDLRYARSYSVWTDIKILLATPRAV